MKEAPNSKKKFKKRPLLQDLEVAKGIYDQRIHDYENVADIIVDVESRSEEEIVSQILQAIN